MKRYDFEFNQAQDSASMEEYPDGEWVRHEEANAEIERMRVEIQKLETFVLLMRAGEREMLPRISALEKALKEASDIDAILAQFRHAYTQLFQHKVRRQAEFAEGLLGPAIERLENSQRIAREALEAKG
jgi:predicted  nucleic acid-binding Zn-ribbon protein